MRINSKLKEQVLKLEKLKEEEKAKMINTFEESLEKYPIYEVISAQEFLKIISDVYKQRKDRIIKIELEEETKKTRTRKNKTENMLENENKNEEGEKFHD